MRSILASTGPVNRRGAARPWPCEGWAPARVPSGHDQNRAQECGHGSTRTCCAGHRSGYRNRTGGSPGTAGCRLSGRAGRAPRRAAGPDRGDVRRGCRPRAGGAHRRDQPGIGGRAVRARRRGVRATGRGVQQRRDRCAGGADRGPDLRAVAGGGGHQPDRAVPVHAGGHPRDEAPGPAGRADHQQRIDLGPRAAPELGAVHVDQARDHRTDQVDFARWPPLRHRLQPDRHRQCPHRHGRPHGQRRAAGQRADRSGAADGRRPRRQRSALHGQPAAGRERAVHDHHGHQDALRRPRLGEKDE